MSVSKKMKLARQLRDATIQEESMIGSLTEGGSIISEVAGSYPGQEPHSGPSKHGYKFRQAESLDEMTAILAGDNYPTQEPHSGPSKHGYKFRQERDNQIFDALLSGADADDVGFRAGPRITMPAPRSSGSVPFSPRGPFRFGRRTGGPAILNVPTPGYPVADSVPVTINVTESFEPEGTEWIESDESEDEISGEPCQHLTLRLPAWKKGKWVAINARVCLDAIKDRLEGADLVSGIGKITSLAKKIAKNKVVQGIVKTAAKASPIGPQLETAYATLKMAKGGNPNAKKKIEKVKAEAAKGNPAAKKDLTALKVAATIDSHVEKEDARKKAESESRGGRWKHGVTASSTK